MYMTIVLCLHKFSLQATLDHHWLSMYYNYSINCCKNIQLQRQLNYMYGMIYHSSKPFLLHMSNVSIDYVIGFGLGQEDGS